MACAGHDRWNTTFLISLLLLWATTAVAQDTFTPVFEPELQTKRATAEITIDGDLSDPGWIGVPMASNFVERQPGDNIPPLVETMAYVTYDDEYLYVAFDCRDDPALLRATMCQRDQYFNDDSVALMIDTFGEAQWAYQLYVNPYGIQKDIMWTNVHGGDRGFDMIWHSAAKITETGYTVEYAIPFASMRFPAGETQTWKVDFWRTHPRESYHQYSWAAHDRNDQCFPCQWGTVSGIEGVAPGRGLEFLPSFISYQTGEISDTTDPDAEFEDNDAKGELTLGAKYSVSSDVTLEASINPDFSQIEADADQIDVNSTIVQRYPERRPFFQEGSDLFRTMFNSFYTRMVNDPGIAAKGTARWEKTSLAYMYARDDNSPYIIPTEERSYSAAPGRSQVHVLRGLQSLGNSSQIGGMLTERQYSVGGRGTIASLDTNLRLTSTLSLLGQYVYSYTEEPENFEISPGETFANGEHTVDLDGETYSGQAFITELRRSSDHWNFILDYNQVDQKYRTQTGYDPWNDQRNSFIFTNYNFNRDEGLIERITPSVFANARWNMANERKWLHANASLRTQLRWAQTGISLGGRWGEEVWSGVVFEDLWSVNLNLNSRPSGWLGYFLAVNHGTNPALFTLDEGLEWSFSAALDIKPVDSLIIEPTFNYITSDNSVTGELLFEQAIARARIRWQLNRRLSLRLVVQHNSSRSPLYEELAKAGSFSNYHMYFGSKWEVDPLVTYRINSFSVFFLGSTHDFHDFNAAFAERGSLHTLTGRQYFMKLQYLFQM